MYHFPIDSIINSNSIIDTVSLLGIKSIDNAAAVINGVIIFCAAVLFSSCGFADLRPVVFSVSPGEQNTVLDEEYSPVSVTFDTEMIKKEAENMLQIGSDTGLVNGDRVWDGNTLLFVPSGGWTAGIRYVMSLSGTARTVDGRELRIEQHTAFFAVNCSPVPLVESFSPADGESVNPRDLFIEIKFTQKMDRPSVETALSVEGSGGLKYEWSDDSKTIRLTPEKNLSAWTVHRWTIKTNANSADGVPLPKEFSAVFCTDLDRELPAVSAVYPVMREGARWIPTGGTLENDLGPALAIAVDFTKPMEDAAFRLIRFEPSLPGLTEKLSDKSVVFIPNRDPEPETVYTLVVPGDAKDLLGLKIGADYRRVFTADIPNMRIVSVKAEGGGESYEWKEGESDRPVLPLPVNEASGGLVRFTVHFSLPLGEEAKQKTALAFSLVPFFPAGLDPIALRYVSWLSADILAMEWERLSAGTSTLPHYYKLTVPGGRGGIDNGGGLYLANDFELFMEAVE